MPRTTTAELLARISALEALLTTQAAPVAPVVAAHIGPSGKPDGRTNACTVEPGVCTKLTRGPLSAASHDASAAHFHARTVA
jgi:hypothetical protein